MTRILIVAKGGYGDVFPMLALAQRLTARGHQATLVAEARWTAAAGQLGIPFIPLDTPEPSGRVGRVLHIFAPIHFAAECASVAEAGRGQSLIVGNQLAYSGAIAARRLQIPWVYCAPSPLAMPSYADPPLLPYLHRLQELSWSSAASQRPYLLLARAASRLATWPISAQQRRFGVRLPGNPRFEGLYSPCLNLLLASPTLVAQAPDWPAHTLISGFTWFEPAYMRNDANASALEAFLAQGAPPVVFAAGGPARTNPGRFFTEGIRACARLGRRVIVVAANRYLADLPRSADLLATGSVPFPELFPRIAAVVHSGGIGTIAWTLRCGVPSLLVPTHWDQFDNARRMHERGLARRLRGSDYRAPRIAVEIERLLADQSLRERLESLRSSITAEDGAAVGSAAIEALLASR
jgi:UDP:flavonoid glycosyltransferase YjiC (YdhE family)